MAYYDDVKTTKIAYIGFMSVMGVLLIIMLLQVLYFQTREDQTAAEQANAGPPTELADLTARQQTTLTQVEVVDREKGIVTVGIRRAMDLVLTELDSGKAPNEVVGPLGPPVPTTGEGPAGAASETTVPENADAAKGGTPKADSTNVDQAKDDSTDDGEPEKNNQPPEKQDEDKS
jgi:hypothetical protein